ncbi:hypothetical protein JOD29_003273 [Lysinibacillus composti]|nr:hypothetical protein [Lysinibacillus composti]
MDEFNTPIDAIPRHKTYNKIRTVCPTLKIQDANKNK